MNNNIDNDDIRSRESIMNLERKREELIERQEYLTQVINKRKNEMISGIEALNKSQKYAEKVLEELAHK